MQVLEENPEEEWVDLMSTLDDDVKNAVVRDVVIIRIEGKGYRQWVRNGRPAAAPPPVQPLPLLAPEGESL